MRTDQKPDAKLYPESEAGPNMAYTISGPVFSFVKTVNSFL